MKFLHTSDLHLGLRLCGCGMNEDIGYILGQIMSIAVEEGCSAVVIAGDIYDKTTPTAESMAIFDGFVTALTSLGVKVIGIYGNHDAPERVAYLSELLTSAGVYLSPEYDGQVMKAHLEDEYGGVNFYLLPFVRSANMRHYFKDYRGLTEEDAVAAQLAHAGVDFSERNVLAAHLYTADDSASADMVGTADFVPARVFEGFDYVALGHLHSAHRVGKDNVYYSGSPLKCSFGSIDRDNGGKQSVYVVDMAEKGSVEVKQVFLTPRHELRDIRGTYAELVSREFRSSQPSLDDYIRAVLTDEDDIPDAVAKLRVIYPNLLKLVYDNSRTKIMREINGDFDFIPSGELEEGLSAMRIFAELYELQNNVPMSDEVAEAAAEIFAEIEEERGSVT